MDTNLLIIKELGEILRGLERERDAEFQKINDRYDKKIESVSQTLSIVRKRAGIDSEVQPTLSLPSDYPAAGTIGDKAVWALRKLDGGPVRQIKVLKYLQQFEPKLSRGAVGNAMSRSPNIDKIVVAGKRPLFKLREHPLPERAQLIEEIESSIKEAKEGLVAQREELNKRYPSLRSEPMLKSVPTPAEYEPDSDSPF